MAETTNQITERDFCRKRGDDYTFIITVQDSAGAAIDITGASFLLTIDPQKNPPTAANNVAQLTGIIVTAAAGTVRFEPSAASVATVGNYHYDVQMTDAAGKVRTILVGQWIIEQDVTK